MSTVARHNAAKVHARRAYRCTNCGKIVHGNGGRASHRYSHERRGESGGLPPYVTGYATFYRLTGERQ